VVRRLAGLRLPTVPAPLQATASGMLGAAVFGMSTGHLSTDVANQPAATAATSTLAATATVAVHAGTADHGGGPTGLGAAPDGDPRPARATAGVALPDGGWVPDHVAHAAAAAAALVWLRRRRRYRPGPPAGARP